MNFSSGFKNRKLLPHNSRFFSLKTVRNAFLLQMYSDLAQLCYYDTGDLLSMKHPFLMLILHGQAPGQKLVTLTNYFKLRWKNVLVTVSYSKEVLSIFGD